jgi:hypothetical protein
MMERLSADHAVCDRIPAEASAAAMSVTCEPSASAV